MGYYENKAKAYSEIRSMMEENTPFEDIVFKIKTHYGFTEKFVQDHFNEIVFRLRREQRDKGLKTTDEVQSEKDEIMFKKVTEQLKRENDNQKE